MRASVSNVFKYYNQIEIFSILLLKPKYFSEFNLKAETKDKNNRNVFISIKNWDNRQIAVFFKTFILENFLPSVGCIID